MKKFICLLICAAALLSLQAAPQKTTLDKLPKNSQEFLQRYFAGETIREVELDRESSWDKYTVWFDNGNRVSFEGGTGNCSEVIMNEGAIPVEVLPAKVRSYLRMHYPNQTVKAMKQTKEGCRIGLANDVWVDFGEDGAFIKAGK